MISESVGAAHDVPLADGLRLRLCASSRRRDDRIAILVVWTRICMAAPAVSIIARQSNTRGHTAMPSGWRLPTVVESRAARIVVASERISGPAAVVPQCGTHHSASAVVGHDRRGVVAARTHPWSRIASVVRRSVRSVPIRACIDRSIDGVRRAIGRVRRGLGWRPRIRDDRDVGGVVGGGSARHHGKQHNSRCETGTTHYSDLTNLHRNNFALSAHQPWRHSLAATSGSPRTSSTAKGTHAKARSSRAQS